METKDKFLVLFGLNVRNIRKKKGFSQEKLAFETGLHRTYIGMIERAEKNITLLNIKKIADGLGINICDLFNNDKISSKE